MKKEEKSLLTLSGDKKEKTTQEQVVELITKHSNTPLKLRVTGDWILIDEIDIKAVETTKSGIFINPNVKQGDVKEMNWSEHPAQGIVIKVGPKVTEVKLLDHVYLVKTPAKAIMYGDKWYALVQTPDIALVIE